jgi:hypothetical protein
LMVGLDVVPDAVERGAALEFVEAALLPVGELPSPTQPDSSAKALPQATSRAHRSP